MTGRQQAYSIRPDKARVIVEDSMELIGQITYQAFALKSLLCPASAWGQLGSTAATGTEQWMQQVNQALLTLIQYHEQLHKLIRNSADRYQNQDLDTEQQYLAIKNNFPC